MKPLNRAADVAELFLWLALQAGDSTLTNMKLLKLLYYAQGFMLAAYRRQLFVEAIESWEHGPVVREVYEANKQFVNHPIPVELQEKPQKLSAEEQDMVESVFNLYGRCDAITLSDWTHREPPWMNSYARSAGITVDALRSFFSTPRMAASKETEEQLITRLLLQYVKGIVDVSGIARAMGQGWSIERAAALLDARGVSRPAGSIGLSEPARSEALRRIERMRGARADQLNADESRIALESQASIRLDH